MDKPPLWAFERASVLAGFAHPVSEAAKAHASSRLYPTMTAFARYIAEHEEAPADPLLVEARRRFADSLPPHLHFISSEARHGRRDSEPTIVALYNLLKENQHG